MVATHIYGYESGKDETSFRPRPTMWSPTYRLLERAKAVARKGNWLRRIKEPPSDKPRAFVGPIAAGAKIVASTKSATYNFIQSNYGNALAVEIGRIWFFRSSSCKSRCGSISCAGHIRFIDSKSEADAEGSQEVAARNASAFAFEVLALFQVSEIQVSGSEKAQITKPKDGASVERQIQCEGTYPIRMKKIDLWLIVRSVSTGKHYPVPISQLENGKWGRAACFGRVNNDFGKRFVLSIVQSSPSANKELLKYREDCAMKNEWHGLSQLPEGCLYQHSITVSRQQKKENSAGVNLINPHYGSDIEILDKKFRHEDIVSTETVAIVTGDTLTSELLDRPVAGFLRDEIDLRGQAKPFRRALSVSNGTWQAEPTLQKCATIAIGGPPVNPLTKLFIDEAAAQGSKPWDNGGHYVVFVKGIRPHVALWGKTAELTRAAVEHYIRSKEGLETLMGMIFWK